MRSTSLFTALLVSLLVLVSSATAIGADPISGQALYIKRCALSYDRPGPRVPLRESLQDLTVFRILRAMNSGVMMTVAYTLKAR